MRKYEFTGETIQVEFLLRTATLHRIKAVAEFGTVKVGDLGGWIEKEENLSHKGEAWVCNNAKVWDDAKVYGNAKVCDNAKVWNKAEVWDDAKVYGNAKVCDNAKVWNKAEVWGDAKVCGKAKVYGNAEVYDKAEVWGDAKVCGKAEVFSANHVLVIGAIGSENVFATFFRDEDNGITVKYGYFLGKIDKFLEEFTQTSGCSKYTSVYKAAAELAKLQIFGEGGKVK